jgi:hypothetical protein
MIASATADRRRYGSPVVRNTYQTEITRHDLNHQHRLMHGQGKRFPAEQGPQALPAALCEEWADFYARHA